MTKYFFSILEIGYCSHMMYRAKYMLVSLHLCTLPFSPTFPFPVGNKWPFCNRILLSWVLIIYALGWYFCKPKNQGDLHKTITNSYNMDIFCFVFLLGENYLRISYRIHFEVMCSVRRNPSWGTCITLSMYKMECDVPFCSFLPWCLGDHGNLCWDEISHPWTWNWGEQKPPVAVWECTTNMKQLLDLSVISLTYKTAIKQLNWTSLMG